MFVSSLNRQTLSTSYHRTLLAFTIIVLRLENPQLYFQRLSVRNEPFVNVKRRLNLLTQSIYSMLSLRGICRLLSILIHRNCNWKLDCGLRLREKLIKLSRGNFKQIDMHEKRLESSASEIQWLMREMKLRTSEAGGSAFIKFVFLSLD